MAPSLTDWLAAPVLRFDSIDSTNNYAMALVNADTALPGTTIVADRQTAGRGQRGREWKGVPGESLLMSLIVAPEADLLRQPTFSATIAVAVAVEIMMNFSKAVVRIKWPNDIYVNDRKAAGILIENSIRGSKWTHAVVGLGLNVSQQEFPDLPFATSLKLEGCDVSSADSLVAPMRLAILDEIYMFMRSGALTAAFDERIWSCYNRFLWRKGAVQRFKEGEREWTGTINGVCRDGTLEILEATGTKRNLHHGEAEWILD